MGKAGTRLQDGFTHFGFVAIATASLPSTFIA
jgi:hypothetical protein